MKSTFQCSLWSCLLLAAAGAAQAQSATVPPSTAAQTVVPPPRSADNTLTTELPPPGFKTMTMETPQGPVTVNWGQPNKLPNAADYHVTVAELDKNGDGVLTKDEIPQDQALYSEFRLVDKNHDGKITPEELSQWH